MKAPEIRYAAPTSLDEALGALAADPDATKVLAGGQSLLPVLNMRLAEPEILLDITRIEELRGAGGAADGRCRYGACTRHADVEDGQVPDVAGGLLRTAARGIGYRAIRNRGTLGGSLAHADPSAEWPVVMAALDAHVTARSVRGSREIACSDLPDGYFTTALADDEIITDVLVPPLPDTARWGLYKFARKAGEFAESVAVAVLQRGEGSVTSARVWLGGAAGTPVRLAGLEQALAAGAELAEPDVLALVAADLTQAGATSAQDEYQRHLHGVTAWRAVTGALRGPVAAAGVGAAAGSEEER